MQAWEFFWARLGVQVTQGVSTASQLSMLQVTQSLLLAQVLVCREVLVQ